MGSRHYRAVMVEAVPRSSLKVVEAELTLPLASFIDSAHTAGLRAALAEKAEQFDWFGSLRVLYG